MNKCSRCLGSEQYEQYHDKERWVPVHDDKILFEFLILEGAQAGLSWITVLKRREGYREAFANWDVQAVSEFDEKKEKELLENPGIIRNKLKVKSAIKNANIFLEIQQEYWSFSEYLWWFVNNQKIRNERQSLDEVPATTPLSDTLSKDLKKRWMSFVGSTIMYAYMQAVGLVNDHVVGCPRWKEIS